MTTLNPDTGPTAESSAVERFLHALSQSGNPDLASVAQAAQENEATAPAPCMMKVSLKQDELLKALTLVMKATRPRSRLPVLGHILMVTRPSILEHVPAQITLTGTNLEMAISLQIDAQVEREGAFTIPAKMLLDCVKTFSKGHTVTLEVQDPYVLITCDKRKFLLKGGLAAREFPRMWQMMVLGKGAPYAIGSDVLRQAIKEVQFATGNDESRPVFTSVCLDVKESLLNLVTSDAFRMAWRTVTLPNKIEGRDAAIQVPASSMRLVAEVIPTDVPVIVAWDQDCARAVFQAGQVQVFTRLVEGTFPNYASVFPSTHETTFTLECKSLEQVVKAFKPFAADSSNILKLSYTESGHVTFQASSEDLGEAYDDLEAIVEGKNGYILFNLQLLADVLKYVPAERFTFFLSGSNRPAVMIPTGRDDYRHVVMPMGENL